MAGDRTKKDQSKGEALKEFFYNPNTGEFCGRTPASWGQIALFYLVYYSCLAGFFAVFLALFFTYVNSDYPVQQDMATMLKNNPGMGFRPQPDFERTLIRFEQGKPSSYNSYTEHIQAYLKNYENENQEGENYIDCENLDDENRDPTKVCRFELDDLGDECTWQNDYGYDDGKPCVLLKANKIYRWNPAVYENGTYPEEVGDRWHQDYIPISCEGENPADKENMGEVKFWPEFGFGRQYYPYLNQEGYRQPLVMAQFQNPKNGVLIQVTCKLWFDGVVHNRNDKAGSIHFELLVD